MPYSHATHLDESLGLRLFVDKRTVDVHIRWLREKLEDDLPTRAALRRCVASATGSKAEASMAEILALLFAVSAAALVWLVIQQRTRLKEAEVLLSHVRATLNQKSTALAASNHR